MPTAAELADLIQDVRLLIADADPGEMAFADDKIERFLALENHRPMRAAARALETYAAHIAQVSGVVRGLLDIRVGGEQSAATLMAVARSLRRGQPVSGSVRLH